MMMHELQMNRQIFDPRIAEHVESLKTFLRTGNWGDVQFHCELPFNNVPACVMSKMLCMLLGVAPEKLEERIARLQTMKLESPVAETAEQKQQRHARAHELVHEFIASIS
jgi:hypothetical protein